MRDELHLLLPHWTSILARGCLEESRHPYSDITEYDGYDYPKSRVRLQFFAKPEFQKPFQMALGDNEDLLDKFRDRIDSAAETDLGIPETNPGKACRYCPHTKFCPETMYSIESNESGASR